VSFDIICPGGFYPSCVSPTTRYRLDGSYLIHYQYVGTKELRRLDGVERERQDDTFGSVMSCSARTPVNELKEEWLRAGWTEDTLAHPLVYTRGTGNTEKSGLTWTASQVRTDIHVTISWPLILLTDLGIPDDW
jgi:hypothetical protein